MLNRIPHLSWVPGWTLRLVLVFCVVAAADLYGQRARLPVSKLKKGDFRNFQATSGLFTLEYPKRNWQVVPGYGASLLLITAPKGEATVGVEHVKLNVPLSASDIGDTFVKYEVDDLKVSRPAATEVTTAILDSDSGPIVTIDFAQISALGPLRVRQYTLPRGEHLYRIVCAASPAFFDRYQPTFEYMVVSLVPQSAAAR